MTSQGKECTVKTESHKQVRIMKGRRRQPTGVGENEVLGVGGVLEKARVLRKRRKN